MTSEMEGRRLRMVSEMEGRRLRMTSEMEGGRTPVELHKASSESNIPRLKEHRQCQVKDAIHLTTWPLT